MRGSKVLVAVGVVAVVAIACVEKGPIITGRRLASADASVAAITVVPAPDLPDDDAPDCRRCEETLNTDTARGTLCRNNGAKPSVRLLNDVVDCVCYDKCIQDCASYCSGSVREASCGPCILTNCVDAYSACLADVR